MNAAVRSDRFPFLRARVITRTCGPIAPIASLPMPFSPKIGLFGLLGSTGGKPNIVLVFSLLSVPSVSHLSWKSSLVIPRPSSPQNEEPVRTVEVDFYTVRVGVVSILKTVR